MFKRPYETTICRPYKEDGFVKAATVAHIEYPLPALTTPVGNELFNALMLTPRDVYNDAVGFGQPVYIEDSKQQKIVLDARPFMRWDRQSDSYRLTSANDFSFQCVRVAIMNYLEREGESGWRTLDRLGNIPMQAFVRWINLALAQRFGVMLEHQIAIQIITGYYYLAMSNPELREPGEHRFEYAERVARAAGVRPPAVTEVVDRLGKLHNADDLVAAIAQHSGSVRLEKLKFVDLFTLIAPSWIGINARENVGVALEHLPTWISMVFSAMGERSYRKTIITQRVESVGRPTEFKPLSNKIFSLVQTQFV